MNYGISYMGSKSKIAKQLIYMFPRADYFVDLFAGGCAMTHAAILSGKYKHIIANDITDAPQLFYNAVNGMYHNEKRWISREDFQILKEKDLYVRYCWSFGNNGKNYMYSKEIEPYKKALHYAFVFRDYSLLDTYSPKIKEIIDADTCLQRRLNMKKGSGALYHILNTAKRLDELPYKYTPKCKPNDTVAKKWDILAFLDGKYSRISLESLESLERLERLQSLERLGRLESKITILKQDYREVAIPENSVVYCDPPYNNTTTYLTDFNSNEFYEWVQQQNRKIYFSEYSAPANFNLLKEIETTSKLSAKGQQKATERLYGHNIIPAQTYSQLLFNF